MNTKEQVQSFILAAARSLSGPRYEWEFSADDLLDETMPRVIPFYKIDRFEVAAQLQALITNGTFKITPSGHLKV